MVSHRLHSRLLGRDVTFQYSEQAIGYALVLLRLAIGWVLFQAGLVKLLDPTWSAAGYLTNAIPEGNLFTGLWGMLAGNPVVDTLNQWGLTLTGFGIMLGALLRWNTFWGVVIMLFYWASKLEGGIMQGLPLAHGWIVNDNIIYALLMFGLGASGTGRLLGVDGYLEQTVVVKQHTWLKYLLG